MSGTRRAPLPDWLAAAILYESPAAYVLNKPAGLPVHPGPRGGPSLEDWLPVLQNGRRHLPRPVHRLDTDTSGCLVLGRTRPAIAALAQAFEKHLARKTYWAVLVGEVAGDAGTIDAPLLKRSTARDGWHMAVDAKGQPAITDWRVLGRAPMGNGGLSWVEFHPRTGRTHQIRAHAAHLGHPILGDARYGGGAGPLHLLARAIALPGPEGEIAATAPIPAPMQKAIRACGG